MGHRDPEDSTADEDHPECPARISSIFGELQRQGLARRCVRVAATPARHATLQLVHTAAHVRAVCGLTSLSKRQLRKASRNALSALLSRTHMRCT